MRKNILALGVFASAALSFGQKPSAVVPLSAVTAPVAKQTSVVSASAITFNQSNVRAIASASEPATMPVPALPSTTAGSIPPVDSVLINGPVIPKSKGGSTNLEIDFNPVLEATVQDIHLRPLYVTAIKLPHMVTTVAVGAPTLFDAEHKDEEPNLVFVKPSTHEPAESNLLIAMEDGETVSVRLISPGDYGSLDNVDSVVNYKGKKSLFAQGGSFGGMDPVTEVSRTSAKPLAGVVARTLPAPPLDVSTALANQNEVAAPQWFTAKDLAQMIRANALAPNNIAIAIGQIRQDGNQMTVAFSVLNVSDHWVMIMPPQVDLSNPLASKKDKKKNGTFAEPVQVAEYHLENPKLSPGARADGSVTIEKPESKMAHESLLLHLATSASIDTPVYFPLPFVAPSTAAASAHADKENPYGGR